MVSVQDRHMSLHRVCIHPTHHGSLRSLRTYSRCMHCCQGMSAWPIHPKVRYIYTCMLVHLYILVYDIDAYCKDLCMGLCVYLACSYIVLICIYFMCYMLFHIGTVERLFSYFHRRELAPGAVLWRQGEPSLSAVVLVSGTLRIYCCIYCIDCT